MARTLLPRTRKRIWPTILTVILDAAIAAGIFWSIYYFNYLVPYKFESPGITFPDRLAGDTTSQDQLSHVISQIVSAGNAVWEMAGLQPQKEQTAMVLEGAGTPRVCNDLGGKFADKFSDAVISTNNSYQSQDLSITVTPYHTGSGDNKISYYVADIYTSNLNCFRTYFAQDTYGSGYKEHITDMSRAITASWWWTGGKRAIPRG